MSNNNDDKQIVLSFADDSDDDDKDNDVIDIKLSTSTFQINSFKLYKYSILFRDKYITKESRKTLSEDILQFQQENHINENNTLLFLQLIQNENVSITDENYWDLRKLAKYFQVKKLNRLLDSYSENHLSDVDSITLQFLEQINNSTELNQYSVDNEIIDALSRQVNDCLQNKFFERLPIQAIYHVISKSDRNNLSSDLLFDFIAKSIKERHVLFHFLTVGKLSDSKYDMLIENYNHSNPQFYNHHIPIDLNHIKALKDENKNLHTELQSEKDKCKLLDQEKNQIQEEKRQTEEEKRRIKEEKRRIEEEKRRIEEEKTRIEEEKRRIEEENAQLQSTIGILNSQNRRIENKMMHLNSKLNHLKTTLFKFNADNPFNGIISHLKAQFGVNIDQTLEITASSVLTSRLIPSNVINYDENSKHFCSGDIENSWISFDFKYNRIIPTSYAIRPKQKKVTPLNWIIEGSNDNRTWKTIDEQKDALVLRDFSPHNFEINNKEGFKFIRMQMKGKNIGGNTYTLIIHSFEFYGTLISTF